ncbi:hypothetical protein C7387_0906 [Yokenella regensburgei]|uniref:Uncharacterized protein n=1 Tax=Yokenella regensburgei TaxID=158877 RepID=A0ABX9S143_9ENTR|nr:hypothetical protein [Yokenella regensburgei]RKR64222.1 hypothetical protein C7387_0906 [Yokenella regensburgei]VFS19088.1 chromosome segregation protein SMC [Yokenella regensburgei]
MSNSLSVRDQNSFISAYKNLLNDSDKRIHKGDVNTLNRILNKCDKIEVGQLLMTKMESYPKDPAGLKDTFSKLFDKLEAQNSKMHDKKEEKLKNIQQKLAPVVLDIHKNEINAHNAKIAAEIEGLSDGLQLISKNISHEKNEIAKLQGSIDKTDAQIKKLHNEIKPLADALKDTSPKDFAAKDAERLKNTEVKISKLEAEQNAEISTLNKKIAAHENSRAVLLDFARRHGVSNAEQDLKKAEAGYIYDKRDTGFGTTSWSDHLGSDKYAIKNFGYDLKEGRREYSDLIKVPNHEGKQWQKLMQNFGDAPKNIKALQREISQLKNEYKSDISQVKLENNLSAKQEIEQRIDFKQKSIRSLENNNEITSRKIKSCHDYISALEARKSPLIAKMDELKSHIKQNS